MTLSCADCHEILGVSISWNPQSLSRHVMGLLYLLQVILTSPLDSIAK